jgi:DNA-binding CsgD family transcriptional regulator
MLLGREAECARIDALLDAARGGASAALMIRGDPGIGKSALLQAAVRRADGMRVVRARGVESESELTFAGLADLLAPLLDRLDGLPPAQSAALAGALALGPPAAPDRFAVYAATLSLLADCAPLLAIVDDAAWIDPATREALLFVARRLQQEGIVVLFAARTAIADLPELVLGGLDREAATALLRAAPEVAARLVEATGGNPLALLELSALLTEAQRAGREPIEDPPPVGSNVERAFSRELDALPEPTRRALLVAAACESGAGADIVAALEQLALGPEALEPAERAGVIAFDGAQVQFRHPLLRSVAYRALAAPERRAAHRALAQALGGERRAWHLAAAAVAPDEAVAAELQEAAAAARRRGGPAAAVRAAERAAALTPDPERRARRLLEAAEDHARIGPPERADALLDAALEHAVEPLLRADLMHLRGRLAARTGATADAADLLVAEASKVAARDAVRAATMMLSAVQPCFQAGLNATGLDIAERANVLAGAAGLPPMPGGIPLGMARLLTGDRERAEPLLVQAAEWLEQAEDPWALGPVLAFGVGQAFCWLEDYDRARGLLQGGIEQARAWSAPALLPYGLLSLSELEFRTGAWASAYAAAGEAADLARETGQFSDEGYALAHLARVQAALGREGACRACAARSLERIEQGGAEINRTLVGSVLGFLELGLGRAEAALGPLEEVATFLDALPPGDPNALQWAPDLVEAYVRVGRAEDAAGTLARQLAHGRGGWARATGERCHGLLAADEEFDLPFRRALELHDTPFETARTELCYGERLRRAGRRTEARAQLHAALERFDRLGAKPWAERARTELRASGAHVRRGAPGATEQLTPQELQVALTVARGATNREAAAALFLSPKTIEFHLRNIYRKLGVRSRTELVARLLS